MAVRRDDTFRFSLQWQANTQERVAVGEFLNKLGNKKSDFIVMTIWEYLQQHPEASVPNARIVITSQSTLNRELVLTELKSLVTTYMSEFFPTTTDLPPAKAGEAVKQVLSESDLDDMLNNLTAFDS